MINTDTWEQRKFGELYEKVNEKNNLSFGVDKIISVANMYFKEDVKESNDGYMRTYNVMRLGDIAFEGNKSKNFSHGRFVENTIGDGIVSHVFDVFRPVMNYDLLFWKYLINNENVMGRIMTRCTKASTMMTNLVAKDFLNEDILVPIIEEQTKIGECIDKIDHLITLHQRKLFLNFAKRNDWEQRKVSELSEKTFGGGTPKTSNDSFWKGNIPWIQSSDLVEGSLFDVEPRKYISQEAVDKSATKLVPEKSVAIVTRVGVGKLAFMPFSYATSQDFLSLNVLKTEPQFTVYALYKKLQSELNAVQGTSIKGVTKDELLAKEVMIPCYKEQEKIGSYLHSLDHLITLHRRAYYNKKGGLTNVHNDNQQHYAIL